MASTANPTATDRDAGMRTPAPNVGLDQSEIVPPESAHDNNVTTTTTTNNNNLRVSSDHSADEKRIGSEAPLAPSPGPPGPPGGPAPDGGLTAWLQVAGSFFLFFNTWGLLNTFGVYQTYYESGRLFTETSSNISWIGSIQAFCLLLIGGLTGPIFDRGYFRILLLIGTFGVVFGHMMLSLCHTFWQVILAQGFVIGLGAGCLFVPGIAILPTYFDKKKGLAIGLAAAGSSTGGIIYPIVFYRLVDQIGFGWATRVLGFLALATQIVPLLVMKQRVMPSKPRALIDWSAFTELPWNFFVLAGLIGFIGLYVGLFYISFYADQQRITDTSLAFYLVPILNAASVFGRTIPNAISDKTGPLNLIIPGALVVGILLFCFQAVSSVAGIVILTLLFGFFSGIYIALPFVIVVNLSKHKPQFIATRMGMLCVCLSGAVLAGGPGAGAILGEGRHLDWTGIWCYGGAASITAGLLYTLVRFKVGGFKLMYKI